jgi:CheY-like chemotaxis protein
MSRIVILCVEDEADVLDAVVRELEGLENTFPVEAAADAAEARALLEEIDQRGDSVGLIFCDHIMPGETGVDLLVALQGDDRWRETRKVLLTGQAGLEATVKAVNEAELSHYIAKPWDVEELATVARRELTEYVKARDLNPMPYLKELDAAALGDQLRRHAGGDR